MGKKLPVFHSCCFCLSLRCGAFTSGIWFMLSHIMSCGFFIYDMVTREHVYDEVPLARVYMMDTLQIICIIIYMVLSIMLIVGVYKKKPKYLRHFFLAGIVMLLVTIVWVCVGLLFVRMWTAAYTFIICAIDFYFLLVVRSSYLEMEANELPKMYCQA